MEAALEEQSPLHQVAGMPDIPYLIVHGDQDTAVNKARHSDRLVAAMRARGLRVNYIEVPGMGHGAIPEDIQAQIHTWLTGGYRG
jgi:dipeptidyl aminopeptidase/acylaminoacyl peptidase